jgi:cytidylate kinase
MQKQIITIAGALGGGKSSTAKLVAQELGYRHFSSGDLFREVANERGISVEEINKVAELETSIDQDVDERLRALGKEDKLVIDSRLAYHWIPNSFKVYLDLDMRIAAERIFTQMHTEGRRSQSASSLEELIEKTRMRKEGERARYEHLYQINVTDLSPFDLVVNTEKHDLTAVVQTVLKRYQQFLKN